MRNTEKSMDRTIGNKLSLKELSQLEELAHRSPTCNSRVVLRLAAALREALQEKENARALARVYRRKAEGAGAGRRKSSQVDLN